jgi:F-type H+-transporting ATPase subunit epsilon
MSTAPPVSLKVITPRQVVCEVEADEVTLPGLDGQIGILPGHRPMVAALGEGMLSYRVGAETSESEVRGGYAEIGPGRVLVFTELREKS